MQAESEAKIITHTARIVGVVRIFESVCLSVCLYVCPEHNSERNDPKVFKLGIWNELWIYWK